MLNLMTEEQVSKLLCVSVASLRRWRLESRGPAFIKVGSLVRYKPEEPKWNFASSMTASFSGRCPGN